MADNRDPKPMPDRNTVLRAVRAHIGDGCNLNMDPDQNWCEWCPYYSFDVHDPPCEMRLLWDIYDLLSPKPLTHTKSDGEYRYGRCPVCDKALYQSASGPDTVKFCSNCGAFLQWPSNK